MKSLVAGDCLSSSTNSAAQAKVFRLRYRIVLIELYLGKYNRHTSPLALKDEQFY
jgi:hypothetical protein